MPTQLIIDARNRLGSLTPLKTDCGRTCSRACCQAGECTGGMHLLPSEQLLLPKADWYTLYLDELSGFGSVDLLECRGTCNREDRPLACRIFPLAPLIKPDGSLDVWMDTRGRPFCPLVRTGLQGLNPEFVTAVQEIFVNLSSHEDMRRWLTAQFQLVKAFREKFI